MKTALGHRLVRELTHHKARAAFTIASLAAAVAGVWLFALPRHLDAAMDDRVEQDQISDVVLRPDGVEIDDVALAELRALPNVSGLEVRSRWFTSMRVGDRVLDVQLVGVRDFDDQQVNVIDADNGAVPTVSPVVQGLTDPQNSRSGLFSTGADGRVEVSDFRGQQHSVDITGVGSTVYYSNQVVDGAAVLYVPVASLWRLAGFDVYTQVEFRVIDNDAVAVEATIDRVRSALAAIRPDVGYNALVDVRPVGEWPGQDEFDNFLVLFWVVAAISMVSALVLVATTMTTLVRGQTREIGVMKAVGGRRRQIAQHFLVSTLVLGAIGTVIGIVVGALMSYALTGYLGREVIGVAPGWEFSWFASGLAVLVGVGGTILASVPAVARGVRIPVREALGDAGLGGTRRHTRLGRMSSRLPLVSRPTQIGLRNLPRHKGRSAATILQVALAVGTMLGFTAMLITMVEVSEQSRSAEGGDIWVWTSGQGKVIDAAAIGAVEGVDGVDRVQPLAYADAAVGATDTFAWALPADPIYPYVLKDGRWFSEAEVSGRQRVAVVGQALANVHDVAVGDDVRVETLFGAVDANVVGIDDNMVGDGLVAFLPLDLLLEMRELDAATEMWVTTTSSDHGDIDRVALAIEEELTGRRYAVGLEARYIQREADRADDRTVIAVVMSLGIPVVAIGMIGLVSAMSTSILERRREIGVLRSIGARARDIRRIFRAEAVALVVAGWVAGLALGYLVGRVILRAVNDAFNVDFALRYPLWPMGAALVFALAMAALAMSRPLRRAARMSPGDALRYE